MNDELKMFVKIFAFLTLLIAPPAMVFSIYAYMDNVKRGMNPSTKLLIEAEAFLIGGTVYAYWLIKRMSWDFWKKDK
jgi:Sec-independent protein secretion pathway component TatC